MSPMHTTTEFAAPMIGCPRKIYCKTDGGIIRLWVDTTTILTLLLRMTKAVEPGSLLFPPLHAQCSLLVYAQIKLLMMSAACSAIAYAVACVWAAMWSGTSDRSATLTFRVPYTLSFRSTTPPRC